MTPPADSERLYGIHSVREALRARRRRLERLLIRRGRRDRELGEIRELAARAGVAAHEVDAGELGTPPGPGAVGQGVALDAGPLPENSLAELASRRATPRWLLALDEVEDPQNVGALARVAEGFGACGLVLTRRRSAPIGPAVSRASAGAIEWLPFSRVGNLVRALADLRELGFWSLALDPDGDADLYRAPDRWLEGDLVLVLGAEGRGLRRLVREVVDHRLAIPLHGRVGSLNVSTAAAAALSELRSRSIRRTPPIPAGRKPAESL